MEVVFLLSAERDLQEAYPTGLLFTRSLISAKIPKRFENGFRNKRIVHLICLSDWNRALERKNSFQLRMDEYAAAMSRVGKGRVGDRKTEFWSDAAAVNFLEARSRMKSGYSFGNAFHICPFIIGIPGVLTATSVRKFRALCDSILPPC